jgi:hypothetical protein
LGVCVTLCQSRVPGQRLVLAWVIIMTSST